MPTEAQLVTKIMIMLDRHTPYANKNHGSPFQRKGRPDIEGCLDGQFVAFEVKLPGKKNTLTRLQQRALQDIRDAGGRAEVIESVAEAEHMLRFWGLIGVS